MGRTARGARVFHLYLDTSALVANYVVESGTEVVERALEDAYTARASEIAYPEARSAFARLHREGAIGEDFLRTLVGWLDEDFDRSVYAPLPADAGVCKLAGRLAERHALRAYDAVQLATALHLRANYRPDPAGDIVSFLTFDQRLRRAAEAEERLRVYEPPAENDGGGDAEGEPGERPTGS